MATVYHRDQVGAPTYSFGASGAVGFAALKRILTSCLIAGYGTTPGAGWELISEGSQHLVLRNGAHSGYVCFTHANTGDYFVTVYVAKTYSGVTNNVIVGDGVKSGISSASTVPHKFHVYFLANSSASSSWYMVADNRSFMLSAIGFHSTAEWVATNDYDARALYVGELSSGHFIAMGGTNTNSSPISTFNHTGVTVLTNPATGLLVDSGSIVVSTPGLRTTSSSSTEVVPVYEAGFTSYRVYAGGVDAGVLRGVACMSELMGIGVSPAAKALGHAAGITSRTLNSILSLGDGYNWFVGASAYTTQSRFFVTDNPAFW